ncbi:hypothetical protein pb186bvf_010335 [Paramecium bursaria]
MPNFVIPFLYRNTLEHKVISIMPNITAGLDGEIIIWKHYQPRTIIYPTISDTHGPLRFMFLIRIPFYNYLDKVEECLVTFHQDCRVRIFDIRDGRCLSISPHEVFTDTIIGCYPINGNQCRFLLFAGLKNIYLFDIWKMKQVKELAIQSKGICKVDINSVCVLDTQNVFHLINFSPLNNEKYTNYYEYLKNHIQIIQDFQEMKLQDGIQITRADFIHNQPIKFMMFTGQFFIIIQSKQIWLVFETYTTPYYICILPTIKLKFRSCEVYDNYILFFSQNSQIYPILLEDIYTILGMAKQYDDFVYGFKEFQITKMAGQKVIKLQYNPQSIVNKYNIEKSLQAIPKDVKKYINRVCMSGSKIYQIYEDVLNVYDFQDLIKSYNFSLFQKENGILLGNTIIRFNPKSILSQDTPIQIQKFIPLGQYQLKQPTQSLYEFLESILSHYFKAKYFSQIKYRVGELKLVSSFIGEDLNYPVYWFGADDGNIYGFPMSYSDNYTIHIILFDKVPINYIYVNEGTLISTSQTGRMLILNIANLQKQTFIKEGLQYNVINQSFNVLMPCGAQRVLRIHHIHNTSFEQDQHPITGYIAVLLENNTIVIIFNCKILNKFIGVKETAHINGLYFDYQGEYWVVTTSEGLAYIFNQKGFFKRAVSIEQYHSLFEVEQKLDKIKLKLKQIHKLNEFKKELQKSISPPLVLIEFYFRNNFVKAPIGHPSLYEVAGNINNIQFTPQKASEILYLIDHNSRKQKLKKCRSLFNKHGEMEFWDLKIGQQTESDDRLFSMVYQQRLDQILNKEIQQFLNNQSNVFQPYIGIQSIGNSVSFVLKSQWATSEYLTCIQSLIIMYYYILQKYKNNQKVTNLMIQTAEILTRNNHIIDQNFIPLNIQILSNFAIDEQNEIMTAACNLIISVINSKQQDLLDSHQKIRQLLSQESHYSNVQVVLLILENYLQEFQEGNKILDNDPKYQYQVLKLINLANCVINPQLCAALLKVFADCMGTFKQSIQPFEQLRCFIFMFFNYNTVIDYMQSIQKDGQQQKAMNVFDKINKQPEEMKKRIKDLIVKSIINIANLHFQEFSNIIKQDILNLETHYLYPCSIIDLIRNYIKYQSQNAQQYLPLLIEIILKSLDPNNPNLRRVCQKSVTTALQTICKLYKCISFHQQTQKIAIGSGINIYIYDLRTAQRWRQLEGHTGQVSALSFDQNGDLLASFSNIDWTLKIWKVKQTGFFGTILGLNARPEKDKKIIQGDTTKIDITWSDGYITLQLGDKRQAFQVN